ncbi:response regulator [Pseudenhygromyxa sp. WMMC2535]|uniref:hybrid sensor histidine kinase/response regulator n=1 Tax=Pseudenhygromyxa sp. WMMC2535 TaxID=2712867 RepID=UPI0015562017|nr:ATP-binding protein [Pseudenhygromyxa sp. WMMC2535]NVB39990.1 response regulator [Pseudenhygromyxa sp. WMMC2535]
MAGELEALVRQVEISALTINERIARIYDALHALHDLTILLHRVEVGKRGAAEAWHHESGFGIDAYGYYERLELLARARAGEVDPLHQIYYADARVAVDPLARARMYAMRDMAAAIAGIKERLAGLAWIYYQDATGFAMTYPMHDPCTVVPPDFDWHSYHTYVAAGPEANPARKIRWAPLNLDYGGQGLMVSPSIPLYVGDELVGVWSFDVKVDELIALSGIERRRSRTTFIVEGDGSLIAHDGMQTVVREQGEVFREELASLGGDFAELDLDDMLAQRSGTRELVDSSGTSLRLIYRAIPNLGWLLMCTVPTRSVLENVERSFFEAFERAKAGDLSHRIADVGGDLQAVVDGFNSMSASVEETLAANARTMSALEASRAHARALFEAAPVGLALLRGLEGEIVDVNPALRRALGREPRAEQVKLGRKEPSALIGERLPALTPQDFRGDLEALIADALACGQAGPVERELLGRDGQLVPVRVIGRRLERDDGCFVLACVEDITEQRRLQSQVLHAQKMHAIGRLASGVAHDFNNLLTVIIGGASLLGLDLDEGEPRELLQSIEDAAEHATALTSQLLAFSKRQVVQPRRLDPMAIIERCQRMLVRLLDDDLCLSLRVAEDLPAIRFDDAQLVQIVMNLVINARDAMPEGGTIEIELTAEDEGSAGPELVLRVRDEGEGMSEAVRERVCEPFFTTKRTGTGLGLATIKEILDGAGGRLEIESRLGEGSTFTCRIPAMTTAPVVAALEPSRQGPLEGLILVVDDDQLVRDIAARSLRREGAEVLTCAGGHEGLAALERHADALRLIITDLMMPGLSGRAFAEKVVAAGWRGPILFMSGYTDDEIHRQGISAQSRGLLRKPFTPSSLLEATRRAIADSRP